MSSSALTIVSLLTFNLVASSVQQLQSGAESQVDDALHYVSPQITSAELIRARGFTAHEFKITTPDNYILSITRGTNPLIVNGSQSERESKFPIIFLHASLLTSKSHLVNSELIKPRVYNESSADLSKMETSQLRRLIGNDPAAKNLPFLAMNFGYEVWMLDRRGYGQSRGLTNRPNRTLTEAFASVPETFFGSLLPAGLSSDSFNSTASKRNRTAAFGRNDKKTRSKFVELATPTNDTTTSSGQGRRQFSLPFSGSFIEQLASFAKLPFALDNAAEFEQEFIDTFDPDYWSFSFDQQAEIDLPTVIDFVLAKSQKDKVHIVAHSGGAAVTLLGLAQKPELASKGKRGCGVIRFQLFHAPSIRPIIDDQLMSHQPTNLRHFQFSSQSILACLGHTIAPVSRVVIWAPPLNLGSLADIDYPLGFALSFIQGYSGPVPLLFQTHQIQTAVQTACATELAQSTLCETLIDSFYGFSGYQAPLRPWLIADSFASTVSGELLHLAQFVHTNVPCKFDYKSASKNIAKYGQAKPPCYDLSKIEVNDMSIYAGGYDAIASTEDVQRTITQLNRPIKIQFVEGAGIFFNHIGYFSHKQADKLTTLPSLLDIARSQARERA